MAQERTYSWIQDRIRELHAGKLSEADSIRLHEIARENPFVADALEGFKNHPDSSHSTNLDHLAQQIKLGRRTRRRWLMPNLTVTAIAASVIIIVAAYSVMTRFDRDESESVYVLVSPDSLPTDSTIPTIAYEPPTDLKADQSVPAPPVREKSNTGAVASVEKSEEKTVTPNSNAAGSDQSTGITNSSAPSTARESRDMEADVIAVETYAKEDAGYFANQLDPDLMARRSSGRVIELTGQPLIGASLNVSKTNLTTTTDLNGRYELYLPLPVTEVEIYQGGYKDTTLLLRQGEEDRTIILSSSILMNEPMLAGAATKTHTTQANRPAGESERSKENEEPSLPLFLQQNAQVPLRSNFYDPGSDVTLEFEVNTKGKPEQIRILSSTGTQKQNEEAIRLVKKYPRWICEKDVYPCRVTYTMYFQ